MHIYMLIKIKLFKDYIRVSDYVIYLSIIQDLEDRRIISSFSLFYIASLWKKEEEEQEEKLLHLILDCRPLVLGGNKLFDL